MGKMLRVTLGGMGVVALALLAPRLYTALKYRAHVYTVRDVPGGPVAIVFGAGLRRSGQPTPVLYDRIATAADLYRAGKVANLLLSGDGLSSAETSAMRQTALDLGVPAGALAIDNGGLSTYDTCRRAKAVFGVTRAILVTQKFHLPRALFICDALGMEGVGVSADRREYHPRSQAFWNLREVFATAAALWDVIRDA